MSDDDLSNDKWMIIYGRSYNLIRRAGRSVGDRYLGMVEAAGSIPARSIIIIFQILNVV